MSLRSHGRHYSLRLPGDRTLPSGTLVAVTGTRSRGAFDANAVRVLAAAPTVTTTGAQSVYVIRLSWSGNSNDLTTGQVDTAMTNASNSFDERSYPQMSLSLQRRA